MPSILHVFPTFVPGGSQMRLVRLINARRNYHVRHFIVSLDGADAAATGLVDQTSVNLIDAAQTKGMGLRQRLPFISQSLNDLSPDVLMTYNWGSIEWALMGLLLGLPHVHWEDGFGPEEQSKLKWRRNMTRAALLRWKSKVVVPSRTLETIAHDKWRLPRSSIHYSPNGVSIPPHQYSRVANPQDIVLGTMATLRPEKNLERLLRTLKDTPPNVRLKIAGDGSSRSGLECLVDELELRSRVTFGGHVDDVYAFLKELSIFCLSSDTEQMPISILEAMASGLPIVSTNVGDVLSMVSEPNKEFVVAKEDFSKALQHLVNSPQLWSTLGQHNREKAISEFQFESMLDRFESFCTPGPAKT